MNKEEILKKHWMGKNDVYEASGNVLSAMEEYGTERYLEGRKSAFKEIELDNIPLLTVDEVYSFMCESGAYMPYNRPTHEMLQNIAKSRLNKTINQ